MKQSPNMVSDAIAKTYPKPAAIYIGDWRAWSGGCGTIHLVTILPFLIVHHHPFFA